MDRGHLHLLRPPVGMCDDLWRLLKLCWNIDPAYRPTMVEVEFQLRECSITISLLHH